MSAWLVVRRKKRKREDKTMEIISTKKAPAAIGPYSQAMVLNGVVYTSGQVALHPETGEVVGTTIEEQAEQVMKNLGEVLKAAGSSYEKTVKTTCFLADMKDFGAFNEIYGKYFTGKPARSCVAVKTLPKNVLCEVEAIAEI
jgi:2-iminobutanoate/2-iminopropanoate deaminase